MSKKGNDPRRFVIVGGGPSAISAAETLRQAGFEGEITMVLKEGYLPYDKTALSKNVMGADIKKILFRDEEFLKKYDINVMPNSEVTSINYDKKFVETKNNKHVHYDGLLIASGGKVRIPNV